MGFLRTTRVSTGPSLTTFFGNPNATAITSISGSIVCSRTSGMTPFFVQVSASGITAVGTTNPYEDLEYSWDFGDPSGVETFTRPTDGATVNANNGQIAPEAAYVYRTAGPKTIMLTIRGRNGGSFTTATVTATINVSLFAAQDTYYFDSNSPAGAGGDGSTMALAYNTLTPLKPLIAFSRRQQFYFAEKSNFVGTLGIDITNSYAGTIANLRFSSYVPVSGTGAKPVVNISSGTELPLQLGNPSNDVKDDIIVQFIKFTNSGTASAPGIVADNNGGAASGTMSNIYLDNCDIVNTLHITGLVGSQFHDDDAGTPSTTKYGMWKCANVSPVYTTSTSASASGSSAVITTGNTIRLTRHNNSSGLDEAIDLTGLDTTAGPNQATISLRCNGSFFIFRITAFTGSGTTTPTITLDSTPSSPLTDWEISAPKHGHYGGPPDWFFMVGCTFSGSGSNGVLDHHIYSGTRNHQLYTWCTFGATGVGGYQRNYGININYNSFTGSLGYARYHCVSQNQFGSTAGASTSLMHDAGQSSPIPAVFTGGGSTSISIGSSNGYGTNPPPEVGDIIMFNSGGALPAGFVSMHEYRIATVAGGTSIYTITVSEPGTPGTIISAPTAGTGGHRALNVAFQYFVTQGNACSNIAGDGPIQFENVISHTFRDNRIWGAAYGRWYSPADQTGPALGPKVYRNRIYIPSGATSVSLSSAAIELSYGKAWPAAIQVTDNIIQDARATTPQCVAVSFSNVSSNGSIIDRNAYYAATDCLYDKITVQTLALWKSQGLDAAGSKSTGSPPGWTVPPTQWSDMN